MLLNMVLCNFDSAPFWKAVFAHALFQIKLLDNVFLLTYQDFDVRELVISLAGRLSEKNPAYVVPALRRRLIQLLTYLEQRYNKLIISVMFC